MIINDYTKVSKSIIESVNPFKINYTQKSAGFKTQTEERPESATKKEKPEIEFFSFTFSLFSIYRFV
jgi:hypothetical protein